MSELRLEVVGASKRFTPPGAGPVDALTEIDLELGPGQAVSIIGRNGAGKSTLLRIAAGITTPSTGTIRRAERTATLIELGAGFEPELSGRENLDLLLAMNGVGSRRRRERLEPIVEMAGLGPAFSSPVKRYSAGMRARLSVAIALHSDPDLLLIDEVLAVGDVAFQRAAMRRVEELRAEGTALVLVTHDPLLAVAAAERSLWIEGGASRGLGPSDRVVGEYTRTLGVTRPPAPWPHTRIESLRLDPEEARAGQGVVVEVDLHRLPGAPGSRLLMELLPPRDLDVWWARSSDEPLHLRTVNVLGVTEEVPIAADSPADVTVRFDLARVPITPPAAELALVVLDEEGDRVVDEAVQPIAMAGPVMHTPLLLEVEATERR